jgi:hypothetical protein
MISKQIIKLETLSMKEIKTHLFPKLPIDSFIKVYSKPGEDK